MSEFTVDLQILDPWRKFIRSVLGDDFRVVIEQTNKSRPKDERKRFNIERPYITLGLPAGITDEQWSKDKQLQEDGKTCISGNKSTTLSMQCYSDPGEDGRNKWEPFELLNKLVDALDDEPIRKVLDNAGLSTNVLNDILNTSVPIETGFEARATLDVECMFRTGRVTDLGEIDKVGITGTYDGEEEPEQLIEKP